MNVWGDALLRRAPVFTTLQWRRDSEEVVESLGRGPADGEAARLTPTQFKRWYTIGQSRGQAPAMQKLPFLEGAEAGAQLDDWQLLKVFRSGQHQTWADETQQEDRYETWQQELSEQPHALLRQASSALRTAVAAAAGALPKAPSADSGRRTRLPVASPEAWCWPDVDAYCSMQYPKPSPTGAPAAKGAASDSGSFLTAPLGGCFEGAACQPSAPTEDEWTIPSGCGWASDRRRSQGGSSSSSTMSSVSFIDHSELSTQQDCRPEPPLGAPQANPAPPPTAAQAPAPLQEAAVVVLAPGPVAPAPNTQTLVAMQRTHQENRVLPAQGVPQQRQAPTAQPPVQRFLSPAACLEQPPSSVAAVQDTQAAVEEQPAPAAAIQDEQQPAPAAAVREEQLAPAAAIREVQELAPAAAIPEVQELAPAAAIQLEEQRALAVHNYQEEQPAPAAAMREEEQPAPAAAIQRDAPAAAIQEQPSRASSPLQLPPPATPCRTRSSRPKQQPSPPLVPPSPASPATSPFHPSSLQLPLFPTSPTASSAPPPAATQGSVPTPQAAAAAAAAAPTPASEHSPGARQRPQPPVSRTPDAGDQSPSHPHETPDLGKEDSSTTTCSEPVTQSPRQRMERKASVSQATQTEELPAGPAAQAPPTDHLHSPTSAPRQPVSCSTAPVVAAPAARRRRPQTSPKAKLGPGRFSSHVKVAPQQLLSNGQQQLIVMLCTVFTTLLFVVAALFALFLFGDRQN